MDGTHEKTPTTPPTRRIELGVGSLLASITRLWVRHLPTVVITSLVLHAPLLYWGASITEDGPTGPQMQRLYVTCVFVNLFLRAWLASGLARSVADEAEPRNWSALRCVGQALRGTWATLLLTLRVVGLAFLLSMLLGIVYRTVEKAAGSARSAPEYFDWTYGMWWVAVALWFVNFGFLLWAAARAFVAVPIARVEGVRAGRAFAESLRRTIGLRGKIVGAILVWVVVQIGVGWLLPLLWTGASLSFRLWLMLGWDVIVGAPLFALLMCVVDRDLRRAAIGPRLESLEVVFE